MRTDAVTLAAAASRAWGLADLLAGVWARRRPVRFVLAQSKAAGFLAALGLGLCFVLLHEAGRADPLWATAVARVTGVVAAVLVLVVPTDRSAVVRPPAAADPGPTAGVIVGISTTGVLDALADRAFVGAAVLGGLGPASVLSSLYPAVTVVLGVLVLRERVHRLPAVGVAAALAGAALIGVG